MSDATSKQQVLILDEAIEHLQWIMARQGDGNMCLRIFANANLRKTQFFDNRNSIKEIENFLEAHARLDDHIFYSVNAFTKEAAKAEFCVPGRLLHVDGDNVSIPPPGPEPTRIVQSSPGNYHLFYEVKTALPPHQAQEFSRKLTKLVGGDPGGHSPAKLFRLPGTLNAKY